MRKYELSTVIICTFRHSHTCCRILQIKMRAVDEVGGKRKSQASCVSSCVVSGVGLGTLYLSVGGSLEATADILDEAHHAAELTGLL
jgi:hypothetical protein